MHTAQPVPSWFQRWWLAIRPRTLPASLAPVVVGLALAWRDDAFQIAPALATLAAAVLLQIAANLANDVFDFRKGADTRERLGPPRVTQMGCLTPRQMFFGLAFVVAIAALLGLYLVWVGGAPILAIGIFAMAGAIGYTAGPFPLAYLGLGDVFAFLFFGVIAVVGTYFIQTGRVSALAVWSSFPIGFLVAAILVVNNLRDIHTDAQVGKKTMAVRFGAEFTKREYLALLAGAYAIALGIAIKGNNTWGVLAVVLSIPLALQNARVVWHQQGRALNAALAGTSQLSLVYALLWSAGLIVNHFFAP